MRYVIAIIFTINQYGFCQTITGMSKPVQLEVPNQTSKHSAISSPVQIKIRAGEKFSGISTPVNLSIGLPKQNSTPVNQEKEITTFNSVTTDNNSIHEVDKNLPNYYSLIIGINDYTYNKPQLQDLNQAVSDARKLHKALIENFIFSKENSITLINPTRQEIIKYLEELATKITSKDNLLIFYAGHGVWDERIKVGYWLPSDAKTEDKSSWISNSTIRDYIAGINSKHTLLITDACFSGSIFKTREVNLTDDAMSNLYRLPSRKAMTSGTLTTVPDESKFMQYFLKRLNDADGKYISARQIFYGLETAVLNNSSTVPQFGVIQNAGDEGGDFIFIKR